MTFVVLGVKDMTRKCTSLFLCGMVILLAACRGAGPTPTPLSPEASVRDAWKRFLDGNPTLAWSNEELRAHGDRVSRNYTHAIESPFFWLSDGVRHQEDQLWLAPSPCDDDDDLPPGDTCGTSATYLTGGGLEVSPVMRHNDVPVIEASGTVRGDYGNERTITAYGGWAEYNGFFIVLVEEENTVEVHAIGYGQPSGSNPSGSGSATWTGVVVGGDVSESDAFGNLIMGDARIVIEDLANPDVDVAFTRMWDLTADTARDDMTWSDLDVTGGVFTDGTTSQNPTITGSFHGPNHEEAGGVFARDDITGAFGAERD